MNILHQWSADGIQYCHFKSNQHLADSLCGKTDLDVLVLIEDQDAAKATLRNKGFIQVTSPPWNSYEGIGDWLGYNQETQTVLHVHLHYVLRVGKKFVKETHLPWEEVILRTREKDNETGVYVTDPNLELLLLLVRIGSKTRNTQLLKARLQNRSPLPQNITAELDYLYNLSSHAEFSKYAELLLPEYKVEYLAIYQELESNRTAKSVGALCKLTQKSTQGYRNLTRVSAVFLFYTRALGIRCRAQLKHVSNSIQLKKTLSTPGVIVAIIGADGSGKSTLCPALVEAFSWKLETKELYMGRHPLLQWFGGLRKKLKSSHKNTKAVTVSRVTAKKNKFVTNFMQLANARYRLRTINRAQRLRKCGYLVITDRFPQTQFMGLNDSPSIQANGMFSRALSWYERKLYARMKNTQPDIVIKLTVPLEVALSRKPDHDKHEIQKKINVVKGLVFPTAHIVTIDTDVYTSTQVLQQAQISIWNYLSKRYEQ